MTDTPSPPPKRFPIPDSPVDLGLPQKEWWKGQKEAIDTIVNGDKKVTLMAAPTGSGKSVMGMAASAAVDPTKAVILCRSKLLQKQYLDSFPDITRNLIGKSNFDCVLPGVENGTLVSDAPCQAGYQCTLKHGGCLYYDNLRAAAASKLVIANYPVWLLGVNLDHDMKKKFGKLDMLVCDEGHALVFGEEMDSLASVELWPKTMYKHHLGPLYFYRDASFYKSMGVKLWPMIKEQYEARLTSWYTKIQAGTLSRKNVQELQELKILSFTFERMAAMANPKDWVVDGPKKKNESPPDGTLIDKWRVKLVPLLGGDRRKLIYKYTNRLLIMSATILPTAETAQFLGLEEDEYQLIELESNFPTENRPIFYWPIGKIGMRSFERLLPKLIHKVDDIIEGNLPERGLIHTTNFTMTKAIMERSKYGDQMVTHESKNRIKIVSRWMEGKGPPILISPSLHEGLDAKDEICRWQIITKVPWPNKGEPIWTARLTLLPDGDKLFSYAAASGIVQMAGRIIRNEQDFGVTYILDGWFEALYNDHSNYFPKWFKDAVIWA